MNVEVDPDDPVRRSGTRKTVIILALIVLGFYVASFFVMGDQ